MANLIQIKRSTTTASPTSLANGEFAYSSNGNVLFIGANGAVEAIGGKRNPGVLTANQALVANSTSGIDKVIVANAVLQKVYANGSFGTAGYLLATDSGGNTFWQNPAALTTAAGGSDTQVQFNSGGAFAGDTGLTFNSTTDTLSTNTVQSNTVNAAVHSVGTNFIANSTGITTTGYANVATTLAAGNTTITGFANVVGDTAALRVGNNTNYTLSNTSGHYPVSNTVASALGSSTQRWTLNATTGSFAGAVSGITTLAAGNTTVTGFVNASASVNSAILSVGTSFVANTTGAYHTGTVNGAVVSVGTNFIANSTQVTAAVPVVMNANVTLGDAAADVIRFNGEVGTNILPSANITYNLGAVGDRWNYIYAANVHSGRGYFEGNVQIGGDLVVTGNVTTQNVSSLEVQDPLIYLAGNNYASDLVDIGFVGNYFDGTTNRHAGLVRHAATDQFYIFKGYTAEPDNNVIDVGNTSLGYVQGTLNAFLDSGKGFVANSTAVTLTANSTVAVNITANSITLTTPLAATSGGTGQNTYGVGDILVAGAGNTLTKLSVGTDGKLLQSNGTTVVYADLDGGTF